MVTRHVLPDGTKVAIRPIEASDEQELQDGLHRLSVETVQRRSSRSAGRGRSSRSPATCG